MPSITTHTYHSLDVYEKLDEKIKISLNPNLKLYQIFSQSFDNFFYYRKIFPCGSKIRKFGSKCHLSNTQSYFYNIINFIIKNNLQQDSEVLAYLYGSINHYVLDSIVHPFVFYKTGTFNKNTDNIKYNGLHADMEFSIDCYLYEKKTNKKFYKWKFYKELLPKIKPSAYLKYMINTIYFKTYNKKNMSKYYFKGYNWSRKLYKHLVYDRFGIKKLFYSIIDKITGKRNPNVKQYSFYKKDINLNYLNHEKKTWNHPCFKELKYNYSFEDLYTKGINLSVEIISNINDILNNKKDIKELANIIPNITYTTGLLVSKNKKMEHFEF